MSRVGPKYKSMVQGSDMRHKNSWVASLVLCTAAALTLSACGDSSTNKVAEQIKTSYEYNGKQVEMVGYLKTTRFTMVRNGVAPVVLVPTMVNDATSATLENIMLKFGKEPNSIYMPERYKGEDIEIRDSTGKVNDINTKFKITGTVVYDSTEKIAEPKPPSGAMVLEMQRKSYEKAKAEYEERVKKGDVYDYRYKVTNVVLTPQ